MNVFRLLAMCAFLLIIIVFCQLRMCPETSSDEKKISFTKEL